MGNIQSIISADLDVIPQSSTQVLLRLRPTQPANTYTRAQIDALVAKIQSDLASFRRSMASSISDIISSIPPASDETIEWFGL